ncbi:hypothetical protein A2926_02375 [Candidatus Giovannonibacteria bacterium RIFCSPLOWO2_01_FULL_44_40]|uniref:Uncharacterized protein n=1 Tax=Candidatus Giovannonibacteria bacterium RIFCSPHIGHO2_01_FULL_45_23 TaxID=1798325 RepID=A0A1F5VHP4_9BACT|nr:MAG: hypothetical protein A2834_02490 [Candidatus Giovannonibacteria bacterium RIFCSPHIGHO2_01_FULL_45_23]OGF75577.1 MAG: hypothetical protein A3C77_01975 [Candidatus Giovannonibacteria bacterium RIFCSPHIGHO2_02_FULL_45_13]OGF79995.1 MAG: hypothetical protein A2926_02375 [Candidatus Giovannonibacteria bacterium RIFCSPLOWO2_01_FULL_44_40]
MKKGVTMVKRLWWAEWEKLVGEGTLVPVYGASPENCHIEDSVIFFGTNIKIYRNVIIAGRITLAGECVIEDGSRIEGDGYIGFGSRIGCKIKDPKIGKFCKIYGAIVDSVISDWCEIGSTEGERPAIKRSFLGQGVTAKHFCGVRDAEIGALTNISEKVSVANYDGVSKQKTKIGAMCMLGINVNIMGGVEIGDECFIADGSRVDHNIPDRTYFNSAKALKYPQLGAHRDSCAWYLFGNYLKLDSAIGPGDRDYFLKMLKEKFGSDEEIKMWLTTPLDRMAGRTPLKCLCRDGYRAVYNVFGEYVDKIFGHEIITKRGISREKKKLLESELKNNLDNPHLWMATSFSNGIFAGFTPLEILKMEGECMIPLLIKWSKAKSII